MFHTFTTRLANCPMALAVPIGIIMGDVRRAVIIGAFVQALYVGIIAGLGGVVATDKLCHVPFDSNRNESRHDS